MLESAAVPDSPKIVHRRDMLATLAAGVAGAVAAPAIAAQESHAHSSAAPDAPARAGTPEQSTPRILDEHRRKMLDGLAEQLVPGSRAAGGTRPPSSDS